MMPNAAPRSASFISDDENSTDKLIRACEKVVSSLPVVERLLVPYFDSASETLAINDVERKLMSNNSNSGRKNIRSGSPTSSVEMVKGSRPVKVAKGHKTPAVLLPFPNSSKAATSPVRPPPCGYNAVASTPVRGSSAAGVAAPAACPAIFKSPKPADLPMPSSALLRRISFVNVAVGMNVMPLALPMIAVA